MVQTANPGGVHGTPSRFPAGALALEDIVSCRSYGATGSAGVWRSVRRESCRKLLECEQSSNGGGSFQQWHAIALCRWSSRAGRHCELQLQELWSDRFSRGVERRAPLSCPKLLECEQSSNFSGVFSRGMPSRYAAGARVLEDIVSYRSYGRQVQLRG